MSASPCWAHLGARSGLGWGGAKGLVDSGDMLVDAVPSKGKIHFQIPSSSCKAGNIVGAHLRMVGT